MKLSELITQAHELYEQRGDLLVMAITPYAQECDCGRERLKVFERAVLRVSPHPDSGRTTLIPGRTGSRYVQHSGAVVLKIEGEV